MYIYHKDGIIHTISSAPASTAGELLFINDFSSPVNENNFRDYIIKNGKPVKKIEANFTKDPKIAFVTVWDIPCGIATYSKFLVDSLTAIHPKVKVFAENREGCQDSENITYCWERGEKLNRLIRELDAYDPDVTIIQHEYGLFPDARRWTSLVYQTQQHNPFVTFHSVYHHKDKAVCEAICDNIIVHSPIAKKVLQDKGIKSSNIYVIPHGCISFTDTGRLWNIYRTEKTIIQFGFGFEYKGWSLALEAVNILKEKHPDIFYIMLFSESKFSNDYHNMQYQNLHKLIEDKGLKDHVGIIRGFQSDQSLNNFLRTARIAVFPYISHPEHMVYGSSGAVRIAMANHTPAIVSKVPLFSDLEGVLPRIDTAEELALEIERLFSDKTYYQSVVKQEKKFIEENSWDITAKKYLNVCLPKKYT